ncbi:MAG: enoyl-CoA hydratase/isomerase family protein [Acidimicrobiales bacterium]
MATDRTYGDEAELGVQIGDDFVATIEIRRPPNNFISLGLVDALAEALGDLDGNDACRAIVLCAAGKHFCAGGDFSEGGAQRSPTGGEARNVYDEADRLFANTKPIVAAIQGAAIGAGLGLSLVADFRVAAPEARFAANFARLGFHHGFVLSATLPRAVGQQRALELLYTGRRVTGEEALAMGLADRLAPLAEVRNAAHELAREIAISAPLAVSSIRQTMRGDMPGLVRSVIAREKTEQGRLRKTEDWKEGVRAMSERRLPDFKGV